MNPRVVVLAGPHVGDDHAALLRDALAAAGTAVLDDVDAATGDDLVVVLLPPQDGEADDDADLHHLDRFGDRLIPVVFGPHASGLYADRSQIVRPVGAEAEVAQRIAQLARLGGKSLVAVNQLSGRARLWDAGGRRPSDLLGPQDSATAPTLVTVARHADHRDTDLLANFVRASATRQSRLRWFRRAVVAVVAVVLVAAIAVSLNQKARADKAADDARSKAAIAQADRLSGLVDGMLRSKPDPDLAWLLADAALSADVNPRSVRAAQLVRAAIPEHRSIPLDGIPVALAGSKSGRFAVAYNDGTVDVRTPDGSVVRSAAVGGTRAVVALSADGGGVALAGKTLRINTSGASGFPAADDRVVPLDEPAVAASWIGSDLWVVSAHAVASVSANGVVADPIPDLPGWLGTLKDLAVTPDGNRIAVVGSGGVWVADRPKMTAVYQSKATGDRHVVLSDGGATMYLLRNNDGAQGVVSVTLNDKDQSERIVGAALGIFDGGRLVLATGSSDSLCPIVPPASAWSACLTAHQGTVTAAVAIGDAGVVSVGTDRFLRIWKDLGAPGYPTPRMNAAGYLEIGHDSPQERISVRSRVTFDPATGSVWTLSYPVGQVTELSADLRPIRTWFVVLPATAALQLSNGGAFLSVHNGTRAVVYRLRHDAPPELAWKGTASQSTLRSLEALSSDGRVLVSASEDRTIVWRDGSLVHDAVGSGTPIGVTFGSADGVTVHFADGRADLIGADVPRAIGERILAVTAAVDGAAKEHVAWVTADRRLMESIDGSPRQIAILPAGLAVYSLSYSPDLTKILVVADDEAMVIQTLDGTTLLDTLSVAKKATIQDVAYLGEDRAVTVEHSGGVRLVNLLKPGPLADDLRTGTPRELSQSERSQYRVGNEAG